MPLGRSDGSYAGPETLLDEDAPAPDMLDRLPGVPPALLGRLDGVEQDYVMARGNCAASCCTNPPSGQTSAIEVYAESGHASFIGRPDRFNHDLAECVSLSGK